MLTESENEALLLIYGALDDCFCDCFEGSVRAERGRWVGYPRTAVVEKRVARLERIFPLRFLRFHSQIRFERNRNENHGGGVGHDDIDFACLGGSISSLLDPNSDSPLQTAPQDDLRIFLEAVTVTLEQQSPLPSLSEGRLYRLFQNHFQLTNTIIY